MNSSTSRLLATIHLIVEIAVAVGFAIGMIPLGYLASSNWVVPLVFASLILALLDGSRTLGRSIFNVAMAFLSYIPLIGFITRLLGLLVSLSVISHFGRMSR